MVEFLTHEWQLCHVTVSYLVGKIQIPLICFIQGFRVTILPEIGQFRIKKLEFLTKNLDNLEFSSILRYSVKKINLTQRIYHLNKIFVIIKKFNC